MTRSSSSQQAAQEGSFAADTPRPRVIDIGDGAHVEVQEWGADRTSDAGTLFVMIPGNPGAVTPYERFMSTIYTLGDGAIRCVTIGHTAHSSHSHGAAPQKSAGRGPHSLDEQVAHKRTVLRLLLAQSPPGTRLILGGHSVGAYCAVELLREPEFSQSCDRAILLFPTLANIGATVNGRRLTPLFRHGLTAAWWIVAGVSLLPEQARRAVVSRFAGAGADAASVESLVEAVLNPDVVVNALYMARTEMHAIREFDEAHWRAIEHKVIAYFGETDGWVNDADIVDIVQRFPRATVERCTEGHGHAFVLSERSSRRLGERAWGWVSSTSGSRAGATTGSGRRRRNSIPRRR